MKMIDTTESLFSEERANAIAKEMNANEDDDWEYRPIHDPKCTGYSFIAIYDENGDFVAKM